MQLDIDRLKAERQKRGWSQEQLAATADLGVRTVQRIESSGRASAESARALASVLEVALADLVAAPVPARGVFTRTRVMAGMTAAVLALGYAGFLVSRANAKEVGMNLVLKSDVSGESTMNFTADDGKPFPIELQGDLRLVLTPKVLKGDQVLLAIELHAYDGGEYKLVGTPKVLLREGQGTSLALERGGGTPVQLRVTPKKR